MWSQETQTQPARESGISRASKECRPASGIGLPQSEDELASRIKRARADRLINGPESIGQNAGTNAPEIAGRRE